jgi:hypothetical protein
MQVWMVAKVKLVVVLTEVLVVVGVLSKGVASALLYWTAQASGPFSTALHSSAMI